MMDLAYYRRRFVSDSFQIAVGDPLRAGAHTSQSTRPFSVDCHNDKYVGGIPKPRGTTGADCTLIVVGPIEGNAFQGQVKYSFDTADDKPSPDNAVEAGRNAVEAGRKVTIKFCAAIRYGKRAG
jgi:hypothetical protein